MSTVAFKGTEIIGDCGIFAAQSSPNGVVARNYDPGPKMLPTSAQGEAAKSYVDPQRPQELCRSRKCKDTASAVSCKARRSSRQQLLPSAQQYDSRGTLREGCGEAARVVAMSSEKKKKRE